jgi:hypothetical protein
MTEKEVKAENRFDIEAQKWDEKPSAVEIATKSSKALLENIPFTKTMNVMDFGCGMREWRGEGKGSGEIEE